MSTPNQIIAPAMTPGDGISRHFTRANLQIGYLQHVDRPQEYNIFLGRLFIMVKTWRSDQGPRTAKELRLENLAAAARPIFAWAGAGEECCVGAL